ncbi:MAG: WD40 repeat domain-containing protein, partial [Spirochaetaceae bacterium]|nr:WD40 repeat domain-containing protein [Spirochaetaceae bacterium]
MGTKKSILFLLCALLITPLLPALNTSYSAQPHSGDVLAMAALPDGSGFFSAGKDGFLVKWDDSSNGDHYQVSEIQVKLIAVHPTKNEVAIYETDNFTIHRVSLWNWKTKTRKFSKKFSHAVVSLAFSAKGTWLMTGTSSMDGLMFLDPNSGNQKNILKQQPGIVPLTFTNAAESTLITYAQTGRITYTDLKTGEVKASFATTPNLTQTVLHNNNLYLSGVSNNTIYTINATTGGVVSEKAEPQPMLVTASSDKEVRYIARDRRQYRFMDSTAGILGVFTIAEEMPEITA